MKITESELIEALAASVKGEAPSDAMTGPELCEAHRISSKRLRDALHILKQQGRLRVHRVMRPRIDDTMSPVSAYTVLPAE